MDICQQLEAKYPENFQQLINHYRSLLNNESYSVPVDRRKTNDRKRTEKLITNLLKVDSCHSEALQMHLRGYSLVQIGKKVGLSKEHIRQIIKPYKNYISEIGSKSWCEIQLKKLLDSYPKTGVLPSNEEIKNFHSKLLPSIKLHLIKKKGSTLRESERLEIVKALNLDIEAEIKSHKTWYKECLIYETREFAKKIGKPDLMPMQSELDKNGRSDLRGAIQRFGGQSKVAQLTGLKYQGRAVAPDGSRTYWTEERIRNFLYNVAEKEGHPGWMPTQAACMNHTPKKNTTVITIFTRAFTHKEPTLSWVEVAHKYGLKYDTKYQKVTLSYVRSFIKSLGNTLHNLTPDEIYILFEKQGINKPKTYKLRTFDNLVKAIQSCIVPREEIDNWANGQSSELIEALLDRKNKTVEEAFKKVNKPLKKTSYKSKAENPQDKSDQANVGAELSIPKIIDTLDARSDV